MKIDISAKFWKKAGVAVSILSLFLLALTVKEFINLDSSDTAPINSIVVTGTGDAYAIPNIATFSFSVTENAPTVSAAQNNAATKTNAVIAKLGALGVDAKDIQTTSYNINPHYDYSQSICSTSYPVICPPSKQTLNGYDVSEDVTVKVRTISKAGDILQAVGALAVQNVSGLQFTIDKQDAINDQARNKAIVDAKQRAQVLADKLGVHLVKVIDYTDNVSSGYPVPYMSAARGVSEDKSVSPDIAPGQNKVSASVSVTYQIK